MRKSKLIRILKLLTEKESKEFIYFLHSPFFSRNPKCIALYELLIPFTPHFSSPKLDAPDFANSIYRSKASLNTLMKDLLRLVEEYLIEQHFKKKKGLRKHFLLEELRKKGEKKHFDFVYKNSLQKLNQSKKSIQSYYEVYLLEVSRLEMLYQYKTEQVVLASQIEKTISSFDKYIIPNHLRLDSAIFNAFRLGLPNNKEIFPESIKSNFETFSKMASLAPYSNEALIKLHWLTLKLQKDKQKEDFINIFNALKSYYNLIDKQDYNHSYKFLLNFCIQKIKEGKTSYYKQLLEVYLFAIDIGALSEEGYLEVFRMKNIIITFVKSNQIEQAHIFLEQYIGSVKPIDQPVIETYCKGYLLFQEQKYSKARGYLQECVNLKGLFELDAQAILYKIYYEANENWAFDIPIESFIARLSRNRARYPKNIDGYINFFHILKTIYRKKTNPNYKKTFEKIRIQLEAMKYLSDKQWLLEKIKELEG